MGRERWPLLLSHKPKYMEHVTRPEDVTNCYRFLGGNKNNDEAGEELSRDYGKTIAKIKYWTTAIPDQLYPQYDQITFWTLSGFDDRCLLYNAAGRERSGQTLR